MKTLLTSLCFLFPVLGWSQAVGTFPNYWGWGMTIPALDYKVIDSGYQWNQLPDTTPTKEHPYTLVSYDVGKAKGQIQYWYYFGKKGLYAIDVVCASGYTHLGRLLFLSNTSLNHPGDNIWKGKGGLVTYKQLPTGDAVYSITPSQN